MNCVKRSPLLEAHDCLIELIEVVEIIIMTAPDSEFSLARNVLKKYADFIKETKKDE
jgi:hypothetical protein